MVAQAQSGENHNVIPRRAPVAPHEMPLDMPREWKKAWMTEVQIKRQSNLHRGLRHSWISHYNPATYKRSPQTPRYWCHSGFRPPRRPPPPPPPLEQPTWLPSELIDRSPGFDSNIEVDFVQLLALWWPEEPKYLGHWTRLRTLCQDTCEMSWYLFRRKPQSDTNRDESGGDINVIHVSTTRREGGGD